MSAPESGWIVRDAFRSRECRKRPVLGLQCVASRLGIGAFGEFSLCTVQKCLGHPQIFGGCLFRSGISRGRNCLPCITHFLHRGRRTATGDDKKQGDQQATSRRTEKCSGYRYSCWIAHRGTLASARTVRQATAVPLTAPSRAATVAGPETVLKPSRP